MTQPNKPGPSWEIEAAEKHFFERRGFYPDEFTWKDAQYGLELRTFIAGIKCAQEKAAAPGEESYSHERVTEILVERDAAVAELSSLKATEAALRENLAEATKALRVIASGTLDEVPPYKYAPMSNLRDFAREFLAKLKAPSDAGEGKKTCPPHSWDQSGERCTKCGDKDWMT